MAKFGCLRSHKRGRPCGRLGFYGSLDPKLYVPAILGLWVYRLFGIAHIPPAVEWKITFIAKFGVPSSPQSRASLLWNETSRLLPSLGCPCSHNRGCNCGRLYFYGSLDTKLYVPAILSPWVQGLFGIYSTYTRLNVESKSRIWPSLGYFAQRLKTTMRDIHLCRTANMSWRIGVVVKQMQSNPITAIYSR